MANYISPIDQPNAFPNARPINLPEVLEGIESSCSIDARELLTPWMRIYDEAICFLIAFHGATQEGADATEDQDHAAIVLNIIARSCGMARAVRLLVQQGLDEPAKVIARSLLETLDLLVVSALDPDFARNFAPDDPEHDEGLFWRSHIGYGRMSSRLESILQSVGANQLEVESLQQRREELGRSLSNTVHNGISSTFRSGFIPSLRFIGKLSPSFLGHVGIHGPSLLVELAQSIHIAGTTIFKMLITTRSPSFIAALPGGVIADTFYASFFSLQDSLDNVDVEPPAFPDEPEENSDDRE